MANPFTYRCFDLVTFEPLTNMPFGMVKFGQSLNAIGSFQGQLLLSDPKIAALEWERSTRPNMVLMVVDLDNMPVAGYILNSRTYTESKRILKVSGQSLEQYFAQRIQAVDYSKPNSSAPYWAANPADPTCVMAQVIYDAISGTIPPVTMPGIGTGYGSIGGSPPYGVTVLINGNAPPNISGASGTGYITNASDKMLVDGINSGVVIGSLVSAVDVATGTAVTAVAQTNHAPTLTGTGFPRSGSNQMDVAGLGSVPIKGMLIHCAGVPQGATITGVTVAGGGQYLITMSQNATATHSGGTATTVTGYYTVTMNHNATATVNGEAVSFSTTTGLAPTPTGNWISGSFPKTQLQTVDSILQTLSQMGYGSGFDYSFDVQYNPGTTFPYLVFNIWYPRSGVHGSANVGLVFTRSMLTEFEYDEDGTTQANGLAETGSGSGGLSAFEADTTDVTINGWPVLEQSVSHSSITNISVLEAIATGDINLYCLPPVTCTVTLPHAQIVDGVLDPSRVNLNQFNTGDDVILRFDSAVPTQSARFPNGFQFEFRITEWTCTVGDSGAIALQTTLTLPPSTSVPPTYPSFA